MNRFYCHSFCVFQIVLVLFCLTIESAIGQQSNSKIQIWPPKEAEFTDEDNDNIRGVGGRDYPIHAFIPKTSFTCNGQLPGFYADEEADCQVFHLCNNNHKISFLCGNGTVFNQKLFTCNWWYNTTCSDSKKFYSLNSELYKVKQKNESKQMAKNDNKGVNFDNNRKFVANPPQKITRLPQSSPQFHSRNPQEVIRQSIGQQVPYKPHLVLNNDPVVRHLVLPDKLEPEAEEVESEEYDDSIQEKGHNNYEISE